jgi:predicted Rossmann fold flavoprotein
VRDFFERELGIPLKTEETGKVFPVSERPEDVVEALLGECRRAGVTLVGDFRVVEARRLEGSNPKGLPRGGFEVVSARGERAASARLVLATGGLSLPKTGSDGGGLEIARALGHTVSPTYSALVPLLSSDARWGELAGLSVRARLRAVRGGKVLEEREGDFLFTHRGFSGPVVLDMSRHLSAPGGEGVSLLVHWGGSPVADWDALLRGGGARSVAALLRDHLPRRLGEGLIAKSGVLAERRASELARDERRRLVEQLEAFPLPVSGNEGYATAEVTGGGIPLEEVSLRTLESRKVPGLYLAGEMLDAVGRIGGYNFLWAFVTGRKAGEGAAGGSGP